MAMSHRGGHAVTSLEGGWLAQLRLAGPVAERSGATAGDGRGTGGCDLAPVEPDERPYQKGENLWNNALSGERPGDTGGLYD